MSTDKYESRWKNGVINLWEKIDDHLWSLTITNKDHTIKSIIDANLVSKLKDIRWTLWRQLKQPHQVKENKFYIKTGNVKKTGCCSLHEYVLRLNNVEKPNNENTYSVDHINRDTLDNRLENLRWATRSEQSKNTDKRERKHNARELPEGITQKDLPRYVTYNKETYNKEKNLTREFFRIEKHPSNIKWATSKSNKISIQDKLAEAYKKLQELGDKIEYIPEFVKKSKRDPNFLAEENGFILTKDMIPVYVNFVKETDKRGCKFEVTIPDTKRVSTSGAKAISLEEKFKAMLSLYEENID